MSIPEIPSEPRPPTNGGWNVFDKFGRTPGLIVSLTAGGVGAIQLAKNDAGAWPIVVLVCFAIVAAIYCAKNRIR